MKTVIILNTHFVILSLTTLVVAGCGSPSNTSQSVLPTVTPIPVYEFVAPTEPPQLATVAALTAAANSGDNLDPALVERGRGRYEALECGTCHGTNGEGTEDGPALAGTTLSEDDFISFLRSGGTIGPDHQYSTNRLSDSGGKNLYQYILSLSGE